MARLSFNTIRWCPKHCPNCVSSSSSPLELPRPGPPRKSVMSPSPAPQRIRAGTLEIAYEESGPADGAPVLLMHGFPYDPRAYDGMVAPLAAAGCRPIVPYLPGYGPTRLLSAPT